MFWRKGCVCIMILRLNLLEVLPLPLGLPDSLAYCRWRYAEPIGNLDLFVPLGQHGEGTSHAIALLIQEAAPADSECRLVRQLDFWRPRG